VKTSPPSPSRSAAPTEDVKPVVTIANSPSSTTAEAMIGVWFSGNPTARHDGIEISGVQPQGAAAGIDLRPGDVILALDDRYLFTIDEVRSELLRHEPGTRLRIRYRRNQLISESYLILGAKAAYAGK
jgi:S1-C subfamily serine protease